MAVPVIPNNPTSPQNPTSPSRPSELAVAAPRRELLVVQEQPEGAGDTFRASRTHATHRDCAATRMLRLSGFMTPGPSSSTMPAAQGSCAAVEQGRARRAIVA